MSLVRQFQQEGQFQNRIFIGQIQGVRPADGIMQVRLTSGQLLKMPIPVYGFSMPIGQAQGEGLQRQSTRASWLRYMPQVGDYVKVGFGPDHRPEAIAAATWGELENERGPIGHLGGYAGVARQRDEGDAGLQQFTDLQEGEWDMRSSGAAYIKGGQFGTLTLSGGLETIQLRKEQGETDARMQLLRLSSVGSQLRFGDVKRTVTDPVLETVVNNPAGAKEFYVEVSKQVAPAPAPANQFYKLQAGDVWSFDAVPIQEVGTAAPLRLREEIFDGLPQTGQPVPYVREVDAAGNITETQGTLAVSHTITGSPIAEFSQTGYLNATLGASASVTIESARVALGSAGASQPVPKGQELVTQIQAITVPTPLGPSGVPINSGAFPATLSTVTFTD